MSSQQPRIPLVDLGWQRDKIRDALQAEFGEVLEQTSFVAGPHVNAFEEAFARFSGMRHCVGVGNGTDALELALRSVGIGPEHECILPANTFIATAEAVVRTGARPVFVDIDPTSYLMDVKAAIDAFTDRTGAVIPVHLYGRLLDVTELRAVAHQKGAVVLEDAAQCQGAQLDGALGWESDIVATSFYPSKNLGAYGDAGAVLTNSGLLADRVRALRSHGATAGRFHDVVGFNSRLDSLQAAVLSVKLGHLDEWNVLRRRAALVYNELLRDSPNIRTPEERGSDHVWHLYVVRVPDRDKVLTALRAEGIDAAVHYPVPLHLARGFAGIDNPPGSLPEAEKAAGEILSLPMYPGITEQQQIRVSETLTRCVQ
jgi:dTDP-4-amino-4,6-dideoxygalactose transaminase